MNTVIDVRELWTNLICIEDINDTLQTFIGQTTLSNVRLPSDSKSSILVAERQFLQRIIWILDAQRFALLVWPARKLSITKESILRLLLYTLALGANSTLVDKTLSRLDIAVLRKLVVEAVLGIFRLFSLLGYEFTTEEEDSLRSALEYLLQQWTNLETLTTTEQAILQSLLIHSTETAHFNPAPALLDISKIPHTEETFFTNVFEEAVDRHTKDQIANMFTNFDDVTSFWRAYDLATVVQYSFIGAGGAVNDLVCSKITAILAPDSQESPLRTILTEYIYRGFSLARAPELIKQFTSTQALDRLRRLQKAELIAFKKVKLGVSKQLSTSLFESPTSVASRRREKKPSAKNENNSVPDVLQLPPESNPAGQLSRESEVPMYEPVSATLTSPMSDMSGYSSHAAAYPLPNSPIELSTQNTIKRKPAPALYQGTAVNSRSYIPSSENRAVEAYGNTNTLSPDVQRTETSRDRQFSVSGSSLEPSMPDRAPPTVPMNNSVPTAATSSPNTYEQSPQAYQSPQYSPNPAISPQHVLYPYSQFPTDRDTNHIQMLMNNLPAPLVVGHLPLAPQDNQYSSQSSHQSTPATVPASLQAASNHYMRTTPTATQITPPPAFSEPASPRNNNGDKGFSPQHIQEALYQSGLEVVHEQPEIRIDPDAFSVMNQSLTDDRSSTRTRSGFLGRFSSDARANKAARTYKLPANLEYCFSTCGSRVLLWTKKESTTLVNLKYPYRDGSAIELNNVQSMNKTDVNMASASIRFVSASAGSTAVVVYVEEAKRLYLIAADNRQQSIDLSNNVSLIHHLVISGDGTFVAVGCGNYVLLYMMFNNALQLAQTLDLAPKLKGLTTRFQRLNFSFDSKKLVTATQVSQTPQNHAVHITVWECSGSQAREEITLDPVKLTVGYADDSGVSSVFYVAETGDRFPARVILTAGVMKSYPSMLYLNKQHKPRHLDLPEKRVDAAAQCQAPATSYNVLVRSGRHKVYLCDTRTGILQLVADLTSERKNMKPQLEKISLGIIMESAMFAIWRKGDNDLKLSKLTIGGKLGVSDTMDLTDTYRSIAGSSYATK